MKHLLGVTIPIVLLGSIVAASVHLAEDRELFVSPPDAVAEGFIRAVITCRYDQARAFLADPNRVTNDALRAWRLGHPDRVEAEIVSRDSRRALVNVRLSSATSSDAFSLSLVFDREWRVEFGVR